MRRPRKSSCRRASSAARNRSRRKRTPVPRNPRLTARRKPRRSPAATEKGAKDSSGAAETAGGKSAEPSAAEQARLPVPLWLWVVIGIGIVALCRHLRTVELGAARSLQDAAQLVLSAGLADPGGARLDRVRARHAVRGGGGRRIRRIRAGGDLSLHRQLARSAKRTARTAAASYGRRRSSWGPSSRSRPF